MIAVIYNQMWLLARVQVAGATCWNNNNMYNGKKSFYCKALSRFKETGGFYQKR